MNFTHSSWFVFLIKFCRIYLLKIFESLNNIVMKFLLSVFLMLTFLSANQAQEKSLVTSDSVSLYINIRGEGLPCLYIHGGPGSGSYWMEKFFGNYLEQHFQMIYLDQRGVGRSGSPKDQNYSMDRMVQDFEEIREELGIKEWITLGHSFGGLLQMGYAQREPESIKGMIMINCALNMKQSYTDSWAPKACEFLNINDIKPLLDESKPIVLRWESLITQLNEKGLMWKMGFSSPENMAKMNATYWDIPNWNSDLGNRVMEVKDYWVDFSEATVDMSIPVLFFYGKKDWMIGPEHYKRVQFPDMILWGSNVGHMPFLENKEDLELAIKSYLEKYDFEIIINNQLFAL